MEVITLSDKRFAKLTDVMIHSLRQHNEVSRVIVMDRGGFETKLSGVEIVPVEDISVNFATGLHRLRHTYTKFRCFELLEDGMFADGDLVFMDSVKEFWDSGHFTAVESCVEKTFNGNPTFNSGLFRYKNFPYEELMEYLHKNQAETLFGEQDILNSFMWERYPGDMKLADIGFNYNYFIWRKKACETRNNNK